MKTDAALALRAQTGDQEALAALLQRHWRTAARVAERLVSDREEVEDILQEAALAAYLNLASLRSPDRFAGWFCGIVLNHCRMHRRRAVRAPRAHPLDGDAGPHDRDVLAIVEERELLRQVTAAVRMLPEAQRQAALLVYFDGLSLKEAAAALEITSSALKVRLHRARQALRSQFAIPHGKPAVHKRKERRPPMVQLEVFDVVSRRHETKDGNEVTQTVILLREQDGSRFLPVWVGEPEATSIALALEGFQSPRPMTYHFTAALLEAAKATVQSVTISKLVKDTFYATVSIQRGSTVEHIDARPSDAINLALRTDAPLFAEEQVLKKAGQRVRVTTDERSGSAALVERFQEQVEGAHTAVSEEEVARAQTAWRELGLEFLTD